MVHTSRGALIGLDDGQIRTFLGVPYAEPPVGELRFAPPVPKHSWRWPRPALLTSPACLQAQFLTASHVTSEDCLYLNVWAPSKPGPHPVMVWIHGGAYNAGGGGSPAYSGKRLAREHDVVVVTINYRLGFFGFLALPELNNESHHGSSGNQGLYDQVEALRFVKREIGHFGGDPNNITVFGESAGSVSTCILLSSPLTAGLINKAIMQSGGCGWRKAVSMAEAESAGRAFLEEVLSCDGPDPLACARAKSTFELRAKVAANLAANLASGKSYQPAAVIDGHLLPDDPIALLERGHNSHIPLLFGDNADEGSLFVLDRGHAADEAGYRQDTARWYPDKDTDQLLALYPLSRYDTAGSADAAMMGDKLFVCTGQQVADILSEAGSTVYRYRFSHAVSSPVAFSMRVFSLDRNPPTPGVIHSAEIPYVFGNQSLYGAFVTADQKRLSRKVMRYWTNFARTGDPNDGMLPYWPRYQTGDRLFLRLDTPIATGSNLKKEECAFWLAP
ncbi:carboxylesterase/lipase family protein [Alcanivorax sp. 1008]|uniref:carboxylesterase/lipase family protein n=1 Tax=Alcanivorax sp. 1008 TaxID=2816853 RepID=UPI001D50D809|nr:carboxylesterase family protein [Alcanivorax sp. 1008]MCC1498156.1 carboxylesterase family protein [Alcanivorax sp. 1008]